MCFATTGAIDCDKASAPARTVRIRQLAPACGAIMAAVARPAPAA
jgi:hypothetical protein